MPRPKKHTEGFCQICNQEAEVCVSGYRDIPFIDGRKYQEICFICSEVPKMYEDNGEGLVEFATFDPKRLHTADELAEDGFDKKRARKCIAAVKRAIKTGPKKKPD